MLVLSAKQRECLLLRSRGLTNKEIAKAVSCSDKTVESQFRKMLSANSGHNNWSLLAEFVREQCKQGVWE